MKKGGFTWWYILLIPLLIFVPYYFIFTNKKVNQTTKAVLAVVYTLFLAFMLITRERLDSITISVSDTTIFLEEKATINYQLEPEDYEVDEVVCKSSNTGIVLVYGNKIEAVGEGQATITCSAEGKNSNIISVTVSLTEEQIIAKQLRQIDPNGEKGYTFLLGKGFTLEFVTDYDRIMKNIDLGSIEGSGQKATEDGVDTIIVSTVENGSFIIKGNGQSVISIRDLKTNDVYINGGVNANYILYTDLLMNKSSLQSNAKALIKEYLKAPSSAEFPGSFFEPYKDWGFFIDGDLVNVYSYVDSQNSFGAMLRNEFLIQYTYKDGYFTPNYIEIEDIREGKYKPFVY